MAASKGFCGAAVGFGFGLVCATVLCSTAWGVEFAGGTGQPDDPYEIATLAQLLTIDPDPNLWDKHYVLTSSIDLSGTTLSGCVISLFRGSFDGRGFAIRNLRIEGEGSPGLFGSIARGATVQNLAVVDAYMWGAGGPAALANMNYGTIRNCHSTGHITGLEAMAGGLVGANFGMVADSHSSATVVGSFGVGGLVANNMGTLSFCHATGEVTGYSQVGGLAGFNYCRITSSYCTATVTGQTQDVGGLVGSNAGVISSSYADATVVGYAYYAGGLTGCNAGYVSNCYSAGSVTGEEMVGGLVGGGQGRVSTSYSVAAVDSWGDQVGGLLGNGYAPNNCYFLDPADGGGPDNNAGTPLTDAQMRRQASFAGWDFCGTGTDGAADLWFMPANAYPVLAWQTEITGWQMIPDVTGLSLDEARAVLAAAGFVPGAVRYDFSRVLPADHVICSDPHSVVPIGTVVNLVASMGAEYDWIANAGDGTAANPYRIETAGQLESLTDHPELWDRCFALQADVDMAGRTYARALIAPDVNDAEAGFQGAPFTGTFDGQGHAIRNLTIRRIDVRHDYVGLFGAIAEEGWVEDLSVTDAYIEGGTGVSRYVGVLAGFNAGTVTDCFVSGLINGGKGGGVVGSNAGTLTNCQADVSRI